MRGDTCRDASKARASGVTERRETFPNSKLVDTVAKPLLAKPSAD